MNKNYEKIFLNSEQEERLLNIQYHTGLSKNEILDNAIHKYLLEFDFSLKNENNNKQEIWKSVFGWENYYEVSNYGRVRSLKRKVGNRTCGNRILIPQSSIWGYLRVGLCKDGKMILKTIHRIVAEAFLPNIENKPVVHHKNSIRTDNRLENLQWATVSENTLYAQDTESNWRGQNHTGSKLTDEQVLDIRNTYEYRKNSYTQLAKKYNVSKGLIALIVRREAWKHI